MVLFFQPDPSPIKIDNNKRRRIKRQNLCNQIKKDKKKINTNMTINCHWNDLEVKTHPLHTAVLLWLLFCAAVLQILKKRYISKI